MINKKAGDTLALTIYRGGKRTTLDSIKLENQPGPNDHALKYEPDEPDVLLHRDFGLRGKILRPGPQGWEMQDLGEMPEVYRFFQQDMNASRPRMRSAGLILRTDDIQYISLGEKAHFFDVPVLRSLMSQRRVRSYF